MYSISGKGLGKWKDSVFGTSDPMRGTIVFIMIGELCTSFSCPTWRASFNANFSRVYIISTTPKRGEREIAGNWPKNINGFALLN